MSYKILSIDGGGVRGLLSSSILYCLEKELNKPLYQVFDLIIGTSTGAILGGAIASGLSCSTISNLYKTESKKIFKESLKSKLTFNMSAPKYNINVLNESLREVLGETKFNQTKIPFIATSYCLEDEEPVYFKNSDVLLADGITASCAAPTYFNLFKLNNKHYVDGGIGINNPTLSAIWEILSKNTSLSDIKVLSLGTGLSYNKLNKTKLIKGGGKLDWIRAALTVAMDFQQDNAHSIATKLLTNKRYLRINEPFSNKNIGDIDDISSLSLLEEEGLKVYSKYKDELLWFLQD